MKKIAFAIFLLILKSLALFAQDVNGVSMGSIMTKEQVVEQFGQPDSYICSKSVDNGTDIIYGYGVGVISYINVLSFNNDEFIGFSISDNRWPVLVHMIEGGVRVGDPLSRLDSLNPQEATWLEKGTYYIPVGDFPVLIYTEQGLIKTIEFSY